MSLIASAPPVRRHASVVKLLAARHRRQRADKAERRHVAHHRFDAKTLGDFRVWGRRKGRDRRNRAGTARQHRQGNAHRYFLHVETPARW